MIGGELLRGGLGKGLENWVGLKGEEISGVN